MGCNLCGGANAEDAMSRGSGRHPVSYDKSKDKIRRVKLKP